MKIGVCVTMDKNCSFSTNKNQTASQLREKSVEDEWSSMQEQIELLKFLNSDVFVFADVSGSIQGEADIPLSKRPQLVQNEWIEYCECHNCIL